MLLLQIIDIRVLIDTNEYTTRNWKSFAKQALIVDANVFMNVVFITNCLEIIHNICMCLIDLIKTSWIEEKK